MCVIISAKPAVRLPPTSRNMQSTVGETLTITVPISGSPTPTVTWLKNGQLLTPSKKVCFATGVIGALLVIGQKVSTQAC